MDLSIFSSAGAWIALLTLSAMEVVLGIDNVVFLSIVAGKLPADQEPKARRLGLTLALGMRLGLLFAITWVMGLTKPLFAVLGHTFSGRDLILLLGGLFLLGKSTMEIFEKLEVEHEAERTGARRGSTTFASALVQIVMLDIVFSLDSVITAVGMAKHLSIMIIAMLVATAVMLIFAGAIGAFVNRHPSMKILALSFLLLIGVMLVAEGMGQHINKGYIYFAMAFALVVEVINLRMRKAHQKPVHLHERYVDVHPPT